LLADPEWPNKVKEGRIEDICPCLGDNEGCLSRSVQQKYVSCTVNPSTGMEKEFTIRPAEKKKTVLVIGGGPAGMEAAWVAALRGHQVTLWEKGGGLGGNLIPASVPDFKQDYKRLIDYLITQIKKVGVNIELGKEASPELIQAIKPQVIFVATGATHIIPEIPGIGKEKVVTASNLLLGKEGIGESVVVIGGGLVGFETALYLKQKGKRIKVVEILDSVMRDVFSTSRMFLIKEFMNSEILTNTKVLEILDEGIRVEDKYGNRNVLNADTVVIALGFQSNKGLYESLKDRGQEIYAIGDCVEPRKVIDAIWEGFRIARLI
jgi:NADPH-dependent 2,4-dienoyl-CoA reductase/sulfur reductase-like enzyme